MMKREQVMAICLAVAPLAVQAGQYDDVADYRNLTPENLPHMQVMIQKALDHSSSGRMSPHKMKKRIRWSSLLPAVEVRYGYNERQQYDYGSVTATQDRFYPEVDLTSSAYNRFEAEKDQYTALEQGSQWQPFWHVYAEWNLNKLVFNRDAIYMRYVKEQQLYYQQRMIKEVIKLYNELQDLIELRGAKEDTKLEIRISAVAVKLDFLTDDYLSAVILASPIKPETIVVNDKTATKPAMAESIKVVDKTKPEETQQTPASAEESAELRQFVESLNSDGGSSFKAKVVE